MNTDNLMRVLLVEDDPGDARLVQAMLPETETVKYEVTRTSSLSEAIACLNQAPMDIVLLDLDLPDSKGPDTVDSLCTAAPDVPVVVLTGDADENTKVAAVLNGVQDFLIKGCTPADMLSRVLCHAVERQRAEGRLRESEQFLRSTLEALPSLIAILDDSGTVLMANHAWRNYATSDNTAGIIVEEGENYLDADLVHKDGKSAGFSAFIAGLRDVLESRQSHLDLEFHCHYSSGGHWFNGRATPFASENARKVIVSFDEITERKKTEHALLASQEQMRQVQKMEAVGRLAGGVAHDFNNLLIPIIVYSELLLEEFRSNDAACKSLEEILKAGHSAKTLVHQLLAFGRKQPLDTKVLQINAVIKDFEGLLNRTIREDIQLRMILAPDLPFVKGDVGQLEQILINLAINAQDAMPSGGTLTIETTDAIIDDAFAAGYRSVSPGRYVMMAVSDTGHGMTPETQAQIFEPFFTTKERDKGTGLGLSTVYGIVKQHGGNIWVYSEPDKGTTFKIHLPVTTGVAAPAIKNQPERRNINGTETILVVEDEAAVRDLTINILKRYGYKVLSAACGLEGLKIIKTNREPLHLLLTDIVMPQINGVELYKKAVQLNPGLKVLYMSGYTDDMILQSGAVTQGAPFIQKPFALLDMVFKIREILDDKSYE
jgi:signal transduction histidine kinase/DNA-binding LytR/AlgR family response regulator